MSGDKLRVGLVGCGRVAEHHLRFLTERRDAEVIALADVSAERAGPVASRFRVPHVYTSLQDLFDGQSIDVLHVLTPPAFHTDQVLAAVERGIHVVVEKPLALSPGDAERVYERAAARGVTVCPDFIQLFHPRMVELTDWIERGRFGPVVHCECHMGLELDIPELREACGLPWGYSLPGGVLHNYVTHPLYLVLRWIGRPRRVQVAARSFGALPQGLTDHLDVLIDGEGASAHVTVSLMAQPGTYWVKIFFPRASVLVNFETLSMIVESASPFPRSVARALHGPGQAVQLCRWTVRNVWDRLRGRLVPYDGLRVLIDRLYGSLRTGCPPPVSPALALAVSRVEHEVVTHAGRVHLNLEPRPAGQSGVRRTERILVTGAAGYLGTHVVRRLVAEGYFVRAFVRPLSHITVLESLGVEVRFGDLRNERQVADAAAGVDVIVHIGAALRGSAEFVRASTVQGTANVAQAARAQGVRRVIYISSLAVYDYQALRNGDTITADSPLEPRPAARGVASAAKREAEDIALASHRDGAPAWTTLRPSVLFGGGRDPLALLGVRRGRWLACLGRPRTRLRLVHVADVAEAVLLAIRHAEAAGRVYTVSHPESVTYREYLSQLPRQAVAAVRVAFVPQWLVLGAALAMYVLGRVRGRPGGLSRRRIAYLYGDVNVDSAPIRNELGWRPAAALRAQIAAEATV